MRGITTTILALILLAAATAAAMAQAPAADETDAAPPGESRDVLLLLPDGPLHLRFRLAIGGESPTDARREYVDRLLATLDGDGDGRISHKETQNSPLFNARRQFADNPFLRSLDVERSVTRRDVEQQVERVGGETVVYRQDGSAAENDIEVFKVLDADESGRIEPPEMRTAAARVAQLDRDRDECVGFDEFLPLPETPDPFAVNLVQLPAEDPAPRPTFATVLRDTREPLLGRRVVRMYDRDRDGRLSAAELGWDAARVKTLDADGDGHLTDRELRDLSALPIDLELAVDLSGHTALSDPNGDADAGADPDKPGGRLTVLASAADRKVPAPRPDLVRLQFGDAQVTFSFRHLDPVAEAVENAMQTFNEIDLDTNGYIDRDETAERYRFERYLFEAIDADGDGKIFGEEMRRYVTLRGEPAASSFQVNVYDTGRGFFQALDANGDGRISIRELRQLDQLLARKAEDGEPLAPDDVGRHYHIEFVRGSYQLFGRAERMAAQGPAFIRRPPVGPIWFQRMDRNGDGDLTWNEFLGPREVFHRLDADGDGLVNHQEAERVDDL